MSVRHQRWRSSSHRCERMNRLFAGRYVSPRSNSVLVPVLRRRGIGLWRAQSVSNRCRPRTIRQPGGPYPPRRCSRLPTYGSTCGSRHDKGPRNLPRLLRPSPGEFEIVSYYPQRYPQKQISLALSIRAGAFGGQLSSAYMQIGVACRAAALGVLLRLPQVTHRSPDRGEPGEETGSGDMTCGT